MASTEQGPWFAKNLEYVLSYSATLREPEVIGPLAEGLRLNFYITGGSFEGPSCKGTVLSVGADWLTICTDGVGILDVRATFKTDDDALIYTAYTGVLDAGADGYQKALEGKLPEVIPLRVCSRMHTVHPKYLWLNRHQFFHFGEANLLTLTVRYDVYAMK